VPHYTNPFKMSAEIFDKVKSVLGEIETASPQSPEEVEQFRIRYLGSKNIIKPLFGEIRHIPNEQKKEFGQLVNTVKQTAEEKFQALKAKSEAAADEAEVNEIDLTAPSEPVSLGSRHPVSITLNRIIDIFTRIGFNVAEDREIEDDWHNFTAMNTPEDHPARDMQDTFYLKNSTEMLLRTHTSSVQARWSLYVDENVSFADMKQTLLYFAQEMYGPETKIRLRPSFFPFTEPSAEMDVSCFICDAEGCSVCKYTGWVEILGCGMIDPEVLKNCGIDPDKYTGFAFGMGIERQAMMLYQINDIRLLFENDVRFLQQFKSAW